MIYLDNAATTKPSRSALKVARDAMRDSWFNPSSLYDDAVKVSQKIKRSRQIIADLIEFKPSQIIFTSGATEGNNAVLAQGWDYIITTPIEHDSVYNTALSLGSKTLICDVDTEGHIDLDMLDNLLHTHKGRILVSIIAVNNEIGTIQKLGLIADTVHSRPETYLHLDATQSMGKLVLRYNLADYVTASAHKFHGIKGVGFLASKHPINSFLKGGHQEMGLRAGTENVPGILSMGTALDEAYEHQYNNYIKVSELRDIMKKELMKIPDMIVNSDDSNPYILNVSFKDVNAESLLLMLSLKRVYVSSGSACNSKSQKVSRILKEINVPDDYIYGTIRISFSDENTYTEVTEAAEIITSCVNIIRRSRGENNDKVLNG